MDVDDSDYVRVVVDYDKSKKGLKDDTDLEKK